MDWFVIISLRLCLKLVHINDAILKVYCLLIYLNNYKKFKDDRTNNLTWNLLPMIYFTNIVLNLQKRRPGATKLRLNACLLQFRTHAYDNMIDSFKVCTFFHDIVLVYFIAPWPLSFSHHSLPIHVTLPLTYKN